MRRARGAHTWLELEPLLLKRVQAATRDVVLLQNDHAPPRASGEERARGRGRGEATHASRANDNNRIKCGALDGLCRQGKPRRVRPPHPLLPARSVVPFD